jgi:m7GpppX diphosphatase
MKPIRVDDILSGLSEQSKILYTCPEFLIMPDMKWDLVTVSSLYLLAIARYQNQEGEIGPRRIRNMRDLKRGDLPWLKKLRREAGKIVKERWSLGEGSVRCFIHYQPSYCEF